MRRIVLKVLSKVNPGDVTIHHHWTGDPLRIHSFRHRGYWYRGLRRERATMLSLVRLLGCGDVVLDVGGHVGYLALHFARLVGADGSVHVFEPGPNNLPYLRRNVGAVPTVRIWEMAVGAEAGMATLHVEELSGQNNTLRDGSREYHGASRNAGVAARTYDVQVPVTTLDAFCGTERIVPSLVKVDVEGFELEVLQGAQQVLRQVRPVLLVEIGANKHEVLALLASAGYAAFTDELLRTDSLHRAANFVFLHEVAHADQIARWCCEGASETS